jgi:hypothetical protein
MFLKIGKRLRVSTVRYHVGSSLLLKHQYSKKQNFYFQVKWIYQLTVVRYGTATCLTPSNQCSAVLLIRFEIVNGSGYGSESKIGQFPPPRPPKKDVRV